MDCKICLILIGVVTLTTCKPAKDESSILVADENELQNLLKTLYSNGKYDIEFSHHEDGPQTHHEDQARISPHDDHSHNSHHLNEPRHSHDETRSSKNSRGEVRHHHDELQGSHKHTNIHKNPSLTNIQNLNLIYKKKHSDTSDNNYDDAESVLGLKTKNSVDKNSVAEVLELLKDFDTNVGKLGRSSSDNRDDDCRGGRCGRIDDNNNNVRISEKDVSNLSPILDLLKDLDKNVRADSKLSRSRNDNRDDDCSGGRCGRSDDYNNDGKNDNVRLCIGDRCGDGRDDRDDRDYKDKNSEKNLNDLSPILDLLNDLDRNVEAGKNLGRASNDNRDDDDDDCRGGCHGRSNDHSIDRSNDNVRVCVGDRCSLDRDDNNDNDNDNKDRADDDYDSGDYIKSIMRVDRDRRLFNTDAYIDQQIKTNAHRYKINDELDAIVLDLAGLQNSLGSSNANDHNKKEPLSNVRLIENVGYPNVLENRNDESVESDNRHNVFDSDSKPINAVVVDLTKSEIDLASQLRELLNNAQGKSNKVRVDEESKILSHNENNNNVYVPKWLLDEVITRSNLRQDDEQDADHALKHLLPMSAKQKQKIVKAIAKKNSIASKRIFRRSVEDDIGVPFHLEVQGLGQVNP